MSESIVHVCLSRGHGGLELYPGRVLPELSRRGWDVHLLALKGSLAAETASARGVNLWNQRSNGAATLDALALARKVKEHRVSLIHCHKSSDLRLAVILKLLVPDINIVFTDHMGATKPKDGWYHRFVYSRVSRIFSISNDTLARNKMAFPYATDRLRRLYLGTDLSAYQRNLSEDKKASLRGELGLPQSKLLITLPGRLSPGKGHKTWLEALAKLATAQIDESWHGVVVGETRGKDGYDTAYSHYLRAFAAEIGLHDRVTFTGYRHDLPDILQLSDIIVIPSVREAFGLTVIEAMAAGKPVVGSDTGAIPEIITPGSGVLFPCKDCGALSEAISALIVDSSLRTSIGKEARIRVADHYSLDSHVSNLEEEYKSIMSA